MIPIATADLVRTLGAARLERRLSEYRTSFPIEEIDAVFPDGRTQQLLLKDLRWEALTPEGRRAKPAFLYEPWREIVAYQSLLPGVLTGPAKCYAASFDPPWLLIERIAGQELYQIGELAEWQRVARWLGEFHCRSRAWLNDDRFPVWDAEHYQRWFRRACRNVPELDRFRNRMAGWIERLAALPASIIHGEFYASNVIVAESRICAVDWEMIARGPGLTDVAALCAGEWSDAERTAMLTAYAEGFGSGEPLAVLEENLRLCRLQAAIQWLGWSDDWQPPSEHTHDWLAEAIVLAEGV